MPSPGTQPNTDPDADTDADTDTDAYAYVNHMASGSSGRRIFVHCGKRTMFHFRDNAMSLPMSMSMSWHLSSRYIPFLLSSWLSKVFKGPVNIPDYGPTYVGITMHCVCMAIDGA
ncbi:GD17389 [Drosophila simulans]|uniref:GD17389 n=1 Tax=Drosophila simulans TaxID=7240 RepID=B4R6Y1_DROSI|nr:GD17389 [Drosophila simulans]